MKESAGKWRQRQKLWPRLAEVWDTEASRAQRSSTLPCAHPVLLGTHGTTPCKHRAATEQGHAEGRAIFRDTKLMAFFLESLEKHCLGEVSPMKYTPPLKVCLPTQHL